MGDWLQEFRYSVRVLSKAPGFSAVAVLSLAIGIGINTAVLGVGRAVLITGLPVPEPDRLFVAYWWRGDPAKGLMNINSGGAKDDRTGRDLSSNYDYGTYTALGHAVRERADLFAFTFLRQANISFEGRPVMGGGMLVSGNYFAGLRVPLHLGRGIDERDDRPDAEPVVVLAYGIWRRAFGSDPAMVGQTIRVNGHPFTIAGVTAPAYFGVSNGGFFPPSDITLPLAAQPLVAPRWSTFMKQMNPPASGTLFTSDRIRWLRVMGRLKPDVDVVEAESLMSAAFLQRLTATTAPPAPGAAPPFVRLLDGAKGLDSMRRSLEGPVYMLGGVAALVFLIACVNIASLVLVRGVSRQQEYWIRVALGAGRARLVRQTIVDCLLLAAAGGALALVLAGWAGRALVWTIVGTTPNAIDVQIDTALVLIATAVSCLAALLFGLIPALQLARRERPEFLRQAGAGAPRLRAGAGLVVAQVAIAVPLVVGAALFLRTIHNLASVDLGFEPRGLITFKIDPTLNRYDEVQMVQLYNRVIERVRALPGVRHAALVENALLSGITSSTTFAIERQTPRSMLMNRVGPGFFETIGLRLVAGRGLGVQDDAAAPPVAVLNEAAAVAFFGRENPVGRQVRTSAVNARMIEIVGVVRDSKYDTLKRSAPATIYLPFSQSPDIGPMFVAVRATVLAGLPEQLRRAVADIDSDLPITELKTQTQQIAERTGSERALTMLLVGFGLFALFLACIGLHGVTSYAVARRTSEIGIRLALGARRADILWLLLRQVVLMSAAGLLIGIPGAALAARAVRAYLFGVEPADPWSIAVGAGVLFLVALGAGALPARRAASLDPLVALRRD
jgi:predicted permease